MTKQEHLWLKLMEECAEVQHRVSKLMQFGPREVEPNYIDSNAIRLRSEVLDLLAVIEILQSQGMIPTIHNPEMVKHFESKSIKIRNFLAYSQSLGLVDK